MTNAKILAALVAVALTSCMRSEPLELDGLEVTATGTLDRAGTVTDYEVDFDRSSLIVLVTWQQGQASPLNSARSSPQVMPWSEDERRNSEDSLSCAFMSRVSSQKMCTEPSEPADMVPNTCAWARPPLTSSDRSSGGSLLIIRRGSKLAPPSVDTV